MAEAASSDNDVSAAIVALLCHLPESFQGFWWTVDEYYDMLRTGGLKDYVSVAQVRAAIRTDKSCIFTSSRCKAKRKYVIADVIIPGFVPDDQEEYFQEVPNHYPRMQIDWFLKSRLPAVEKAIATIASHHCNTSDKESGDAMQMEAQLVSGIKLIDIDVDREWTNIIAEHAMKCRSLFQFVKSGKKGFEVVDFYQCKHCHQMLWKRACRPSQQSVMEPPEKRGPKRGELNGLMAIASYTAGVTPARLEEMCANA
jgi:hypothetical protein